MHFTDEFNEITRKYQKQIDFICSKYSEIEEDESSYVSFVDNKIREHHSRKTKNKKTYKKHKTKIKNKENTIELSDKNIETLKIKTNKINFTNNKKANKVKICKTFKYTHFNEILRYYLE